jgi:hypothetical protein
MHGKSHGKKDFCLKKIGVDMGVPQVMALFIWDTDDNP